MVHGKLKEGRSGLGAWVARAIGPVVSPRLVSCRATRDAVLPQAAAVSGLTALGRTIAVPTASVNTLADARWVAVPDRYLVSRKVDGVRHLLIVASDGTPYLLNRAGSLYAYPLTAPGDLPPGTVLDGELVWKGKDSGGSAAGAGCTNAGERAPVPSSGHCRGFFIAFDELCIGGARVWHLHLQQRLQRMVTQLGLTEAEECGQLQTAAAAAAATADPQLTEVPAAAAASTSATATTSPAASSRQQSVLAGIVRQPCQQPTAPKPLPKKQQAPPLGEDSITLVYKRHLPVSAQVLSDLESTRTSCPYPTDGLIFTPAAIPYVLGMQELLLKWQAPTQVAADITGTALQERAARLPSSATTPTNRATIENLVPELVYECVLSSPPDTPSSAGTRAEVAAAAGLTTASAMSMLAAMRKASQSRQQLPWVPVSVRWDKAVGNAAEAVAAMEQRMGDGAWVSHAQLVEAVKQTQEWIHAAPSATPAATAIDSSSAGVGAVEPTTSRVHPARTMPFDELYAHVMRAVEEGSVGRWVDAGSGLEIFNYRPVPDGTADGAAAGLAIPADIATAAAAAGAADPASSHKLDSGPAQAAVSPGSGAADITSVCRGLVLHPATRTVAATPFVKFQELQVLRNMIASTHASAAPILSTCTDPESWLQGGPADMASAELYRNWPGSQSDSAADQSDSAAHQSDLAAASPKVDGSLVIAFLWEGRLRVATRRRMDSEQALWATNWLSSRTTAASLEPGWTYMFEAVYPDNTHVVAYPFEGLVLLGAVSPQGLEVRPGAALYQLGQRLGVVAVPCITGSWAELCSRLSRSTKLDVARNCVHPTSSSAGAHSTVGGPARNPFGSSPEPSLHLFAAQAAPAMKPSVLATAEGWVVSGPDGSRHKLVQERYKRCALALQALHPLMVWDAVRRGGASREQLAAGLPAHGQQELGAILEVLDSRFTAVQQRLQRAVDARPSQEPQWLGENASSGRTRDAVGLQPVDQQGEAGVPSAAPSGHDAVLAVEQVQALLSGLSLSTGSQPNEEALQRALQYAVQHDSASCSSMFYDSQASRFNPAPLLRAKILDCICPAQDGSLPGYTPSPAFKQTYAKGWARGPRDGPYAPHTTTPSILQLPDGHTMSFLGLLEGKDMMRAVLVCNQWGQLLVGHPDFDSKVQRGKKETEEAARHRYEYEYSSGGYDYSDSDYNSYGGYGSP